MVRSDILEYIILREVLKKYTIGTGIEVNLEIHKNYFTTKLS